MSDRTADTALATKVRAAFVNTREIAFNSIEIVTERGIVYLLGLVTEQEGQIAALVASKVSGVKQVVKVFDYASREEIERAARSGPRARRRRRRPLPRRRPLRRSPTAPAK